MLTDFRLKIRNFIKKHKWKVVVFIVIWSILIAINVILKNIPNDTPITTYTPHEPIIENGDTTPKKWQDDIENYIKQYVDYCNKKDYEKAYNMISENCREKIYPNIDEFKAYVDYVFSSPKVYSIQNFSNRDNVYIYRVRLFEDILATGLTYSETLQYFEDRFIFTEDNGKLLMSVKSYIGDEKTDYMYEDQYMRITIKSKSIMYDEEIYNIEVQNKTEYTIVLADDETANEISFIVQGENRPMLVEEKWQAIYVKPRSNNNFTISCTQFFDEGVNTTGINFDSVRVLRSYSGKEELKEQELENAVSLYGFTLSLE